MRTSAYAKIGVKLTGEESLSEATEKIYPHVLIEADLYGKVGDQFSDSKVPDKKGIYKDNGDYVSTVGDRYGLVQPFESISYMQSYLETSELKLTHGGQLDGGRKMFLLSEVKTAKVDIVVGDTVSLSLLSSTSFDGSSRNRVDILISRLACLNGAVRSQSIFSIGFKHTSKIHQRLERAKHEIHLAIDEFMKTTEAYKALAKKQVTDKQIETYVRDVLVSGDEETVGANMQNKIDRVVELAHVGAGQDIPGVRGTAWAAYNGVTEYLTHEYGRNDESRLEAQWFGASAKIGERAMVMAMAM